MTTYLIGALICLALSAFFSGSEMAFSSANRIRLENQAEDGSRLAALAVRIIDHYDDALSAILIGNNFVNIALSSLGSIIAITAFGEEDTWIATVIVTVSVIIFGETMPKIVAKKNANRLSLAFAGPVRFLTVIFKPLTLLVVGLGVAFDKKDDRGLAQKLTETFEEMREDGTMKEIVGTYMEDTDCYLEVRTDET